MKSDERGYIVVEGIIVFVPFVIVIALILGTIQFAFLQMKVQYALTQSAQQVSMYSYLFRSSGIAKSIQQSNEFSTDIHNVKENFTGMANDVSGVMNGIDSIAEIANIMGIFGDIKQKFQDIKSTIGKYISDPEGTFDKIPGIAGGTALRYAVKGLSDFIFKKQFSVETAFDGGGDGYQKFMKDYGIANDKIDVDVNPTHEKNHFTLTYTYDVNLSFGRVFLPFDPKITITQSVTTGLWIGVGPQYEEK